MTERAAQLLCTNCGTDHGDVTPGKWYLVPIGCCTDPRPVLRPRPDEAPRCRLVAAGLIRCRHVLWTALSGEYAAQQALLWATAQTIIKET